MNKSYSVIANSYDNLTHNDCDYNSWSQYLFAVAKAHNVKSVVDIANNVYFPNDEVNARNKIREKFRKKNKK